MKGNTPLCVDLDKSLVNTDTFFELLITAIKNREASLLRLPIWLSQGIAFTKRRLAELTPLDTEYLPYNYNVLQFVNEEHNKGRRLILATGADEIVANKVAAHLKIFSEVIASNGETNISAKKKGEILREKFGDRGFDYIGDGYRDRHVWKYARQALLVQPAKRTLRAANRVSIVRRVFAQPTTKRLSSWARALRPYQWVKNTLVFAPLVMAHQINEPSVVIPAIIAFFSLSLCASALYLLNDLFDLPNDRRHRTKCRRPLAAGQVMISTAIFTIPTLLLLSLALAYFLPLNFFWILIIYAVTSLTYSWHLKGVAIVDVVILSLLYVIRAVAGAQASHVPLSFWFSTFAMFIFLSLALLKRLVEVNKLANGNAAKSNAKVNGRAYLPSDAPILTSLASASGYLSILVLALYINHPDVSALYHTPFILWFICPLLFYWISRMLLTAHRGTMNDDPIFFSITDLNSYVVGALVILVLVLAT